MDSYATHAYGNSHAGLIFYFFRREQSCDAPVGCGLPGQAPASCMPAGLIHSSTSLPKGVLGLGARSCTCYLFGLMSQEVV